MMNLYERTDAKLKIAQKFIKDVKKVAEENGKQKFVDWINKVQKEIDAI